MGRVLIVGLCCIDLVNYVDKFPAEDSDTRVFEQRTCLGGNAANSATVFGQLARAGSDTCELFAALPEGNLLLDTLISQSALKIGQSPRRPNAQCPISTVIVNRQSNTRTILHYRGELKELTGEEFRRANATKTGQFDWVHFEGRNFDEVRLMMEFVRGGRQQGRGPRVSVELEKLRPFPCLEQLIPLADLIFVSKDFARSKGWQSVHAAIDGIQRQLGAPDTTVICAWGEKGAAARERLNTELLLQPAFDLPGPVLDTLGAGDCFIGAALVHLARAEPLDRVLAEAVRVAGIKCTRKGLTGLADLAG